MSAEIEPRRTVNQPVVPHDRDHVTFLPGPDLGHHDPARRERASELRRQRPIGVQSIGAAVQRLPRIVVADLGREAGDLGRDDIGRVRDNEIEAPGHDREPVAADKPGALADAVAQGVAGRGRAGVSREIDAEPPRLPAFAEQRDEQAAASRAEIENGDRLVATRTERRQGRLHDGFAVGPRFERRRRQREGETPELALAENPPDRFAGEAAARPVLENVPRGGRQARARIGGGRDAAQRGFDQKARVERGAGDACIAKTRGESSPRVTDR